MVLEQSVLVDSGGWDYVIRDSTVHIMYNGVYARSSVLVIQTHTVKSLKWIQIRTYVV